MTTATHMTFATKRIERQGWYVVACDHQANPPAEALVQQ